MSVPAQRLELSIDEQIKQAQLAKLEEEVRQLSGFHLETAAKLIVALLAISAAVYAFIIGLPQAKIDLYDAQQKVASAIEKAASAAQAVAKHEAEILRKSQELSDTEGRRLRATDELAKLQQAIAAIGNSASAPAAAASVLRQDIAQAARPRLFIQFAGALNREATINPLRQALAAQGFNVPEAERINRGQSNEVRYFTADDARRATQIADATVKYFQDVGCPLPSLKTTLVKLEGAKQSPIELWLQHNCQTR